MILRFPLSTSESITICEKYKSGIRTLQSKRYLIYCSVKLKKEQHLALPKLLAKLPIVYNLLWVFPVHVLSYNLHSPRTPLLIMPIAWSRSPLVSLSTYNNITSFENSKNVLVHIELPSEHFIDYLCLVDKFIITTGSQNLYRITNKISIKSSLNLCIRDDDYIDNQVHYLC